MIDQNIRVQGGNTVSYFQSKENNRERYKRLTLLEKCMWLKEKDEAIQDEKIDPRRDDLGANSEITNCVFYQSRLIQK